MNRTSRWTLTFSVFVAGIVFAQAPVVPQGGVVSAASLLPFGAPGYQLSPGAIVSIFGTNLAASSGGAVGLPLPTILNGAKVTIGNIAAPIFYASPSQINAQIPYTVTPGANVTVSVQNSVGSTTLFIPVVAAAPTLFSASQNGLGNAAAQNYVSATSTPANSFNVAIPQGGILIAYGTGGGAIAGATTGAACPGGTFTGTPASATIAGQLATVNYAGCSPGFVGLDQWNIVIPSTVPDGCYLPVQVTVNGVSSNTVTISVAKSGNCSTAATGQPQVGAGQALGSLSLSHSTFSAAGAGNFSNSSFSGTFQKNGAVTSSATAGLPPAGAGCLVQVYKSSSSSPPSATTPGTPLDAGVLTLKTPSSGSVTLPPSPIGTYNSAVTGFPAVTTGAYSISGAGGANVGAFGPTTITLPALLTVTNPGFSGTSFSQAQSLSPALTCPDPAGEIVVEILSGTSSGLQGIALCTFACGSNVVVPSSVLKQLPVSASGMADLFFLFLAPNNNAGVTSKQFTATGLDLGLFSYTDTYGLASLTLTP